MEQELDQAGTRSERDSNLVIEQLLDERAQSVEDARDADLITYIGPIFALAVDAIKDAIEARDERRDRVLIVIETTGGFIDSAERIARVIRHHYGQVQFLVPSFAMSAGTVLVMSGDSILMDYSSVLGPIDPQVMVEGAGHAVPALGYLEQYERLVEKSRQGTLTTAELAYLVQNFDPAQLYRYEQERELSIALLKEWLVKYKFRNWKETETRKKPVTKQMKTRRAREIAAKLNKIDRWHSHSRGIPMEVLRRDLKLLIEDFGADVTLSPVVHDYYRLLRDYNMRRAHELMILHRKGQYVGY